MNRYFEAKDVLLCEECNKRIYENEKYFVIGKKTYHTFCLLERYSSKELLALAGIKEKML